MFITIKKLVWESCELSDAFCNSYRDFRARILGKLGKKLQAEAKKKRRNERICREP